MNKNQIIEALFTGKNFNDVIRKMEPQHLQDDLRMEVIAIVCEWPEEKIVGLHQRKELDFFVVRVILNQIQSNSSPFYKKYRGHVQFFTEYGANTFGDGNDINKHSQRIGAMVDATNVQEDIEARQIREDMEDKALEEIDNLYWYNANLLKLYGQHGSYRALQAATGIPYVSCYHTIRKSIKQVKDIAHAQFLSDTNRPVLSLLPDRGDPVWISEAL